MKIALAQINQVIGDFEGNFKRIETAVSRAEKMDADLVVFPETATCGPFPGDLLIYDKFVRDNLELLDRLTARAGRTGILIGYVRPSPRSNKLENAAALIADGQIVSTHVKTRLAVHGGFDEFRYFEAGDATKPVDFRGVRFGVTICEDICRPEYPGNRRPIGPDPTAEAVTHGAEIIINLGASPFTLENRKARLHALRDCAVTHRRPVLFVNHVGGNDEWVFDGQSVALDAEGRIIQAAEAFEEDLVLVDVETEGRDDIEVFEPDPDTVIRALVLGTRDFVHKRGRTSVLTALNGDVNSAVTAAIAAAALGGRNVHAVYLGPPAFGNPVQLDVFDFAACIGIGMDNYDAEMIARIGDTISSATDISGAEKLSQPTDSAVGQMILKTTADAGGHMLLSTDDKTDFYLKGPTFPAAEFSILSDIPKSLLWKTARCLGEMGIPPFLHISNELPDPSYLFSTDLDVFPASLDEIDLILDHCLVQRLCSETVISLGFNALLTEKIVRMIKETEATRRRAPLGINITTQCFGSYPHLPLGHQWTSRLRPISNG